LSNLPIERCDRRSEDDRSSVSVFDLISAHFRSGESEDVIGTKQIDAEDLIEGVEISGSPLFIDYSYSIATATCTVHHSAKGPRGSGERDRGGEFVLISDVGSGELRTAAQPGRSLGPVR